MITKTYSALMQGLTPHQVEIECQTTQGKPNLILIGLANQALEEAKERICSALASCNVRLKNRKTIINLAPAQLRKDNSCLELAIAVSLYLTTLENAVDVSKNIYFGELSLAGEIRPIRGALSLVLAAKELGFKNVFLPKAQLEEVKVVDGVNVYGLDHLQTLLDFLHKKIALKPLEPKSFHPNNNKRSDANFSQIIGQENAKRCLEIAAAGGHNLLLMGVPGSGKSMLASSLTSILPPLTKEEAIAVTKIYSLCGLLDDDGLITKRPFRSPHHSISSVGLVGGSSKLLPGEISLSHHGILFLDELAEFKREALEALRQPLESGEVAITRAVGRVVFPANFTLIAASNPCPCGHYGSKRQPCTCSTLTRDKYLKKLSGPILDRIDMQIFVGEVDGDALMKKDDKNKSQNNSDSSVILDRVCQAREVQSWRLKKHGLVTNCQLTSPLVREICGLNLDSQKLLTSAVEKWQLSARSYFKIIKVARTIADLQASPDERIQKKHLAEALQYRLGLNNSF
ncbi:MAG: YifB family Mg chelatase-like AAA ATPase [Pseudomonadales bacterium]|jgi:magnesium chelatase family protein|nr:YifB family Mg chelatase-like AAA ATPase [Pseudomonadales bacterium]